MTKKLSYFAMTLLTITMVFPLCSFAQGPRGDYPTDALSRHREIQRDYYIVQSRINRQQRVIPPAQTDIKKHTPSINLNSPTQTEIKKKPQANRWFRF